jgi:hypothetical protein
MDLPFKNLINFMKWASTWTRPVAVSKLLSVAAIASCAEISGLHRVPIKVIELAVDEARRLDHQYVGTEHLLLGLIREGNGIGAGVLKSFSINLHQVRRQVMRMIEHHPPTASRARPLVVAVTTALIASAIGRVLQRKAER